MIVKSVTEYDIDRHLVPAELSEEPHLRRVKGQKEWEYDFGDGDDIGAIMTGPDPEERSELELFTRLGSGYEQSQYREASVDASEEAFTPNGQSYYSIFDILVAR